MNKKTVYSKSLKLMGNGCQISAVGENEVWADERIDAAINEIQRIEKLLTTFNDGSETHRINEHAGIEPVKVSPETFEIIERSIRISSVTQGAFDISYGSVDKRFWNFDTTMKSLPDEKAAKQAVKLINYRNITLDKEKTTVFLKEKGMRIGFGGIGKGYAAERAKQVMKDLDVENGIVNASGDLTAWGYQPNGKPWTIGIANPNSKEEIFSYMDITNMSIATSGNYEKYAVINGKKYSHTIDPRTGFPVTGIKSVTILSPNAEIADAMATPVMIMGINTGLNMINQIKDIEAIIIDDDDHIYSSNNIHFN
jgi:FAD:protein FMN transferase